MKWNQRLRPYRTPDLKRSIWQIVNSAVPFVGLWYLMLQSLAWPYWTTLLLSVPTSAFLIRLFIIQHDCGHGSFFTSKRACDLLGGAIGVLALTPYQYWKREHALHHATSGLLDRRGHGDIDTLTVDEYMALGAFARFRYRLYRHPFVLFGIGPAFQFLVLQRLPLNAMPATRSGWWSIIGTNIAIAAVVTGMILLVGAKPFLLVQLPITLVASSMGVWLFYIQHQYEGTYWREKPEWNYNDAALQGSSWYDLGRVLQWFSGNIGLHHIHHLNSAIPNYRLQQVLDEVPELQENVTRLSLLGSLKCARLALWDSKQRELIGFSKLKRMTA